MKNSICLLALVTLFSCQENTVSTEVPASVSDTTAIVKSPVDSPEEVQELKSVEDIQKEYALITAKIKSSLDSTSFNYNCNGEKNGTVTYFSEKGKLRLVKHTYNEYSHFSAVDNYFVKDNALFFVLQRHVTWSFVDQNQTKDNVTETRVYLIDKKPAKCLQKKFTIDTKDKGSSQENTIANKEIDCASLKPVSEKFGLLLKHAGRQQDLACLED